MIKVLHYGLSSNMGGIETYLYKLFSNINRKEFQFDFIDDTIEGPCFYHEFKEMGSYFYKITHRSISVFKNKKDLEQIFRNNHFDILHCHLNTLSYIEPIKMALKYNCKVIVHSRNAGSSNKLHTNILHFYHSLLLPRNKIKMLAVSTEAGHWLYGNNSECTVINNGVDINKFKFNYEKRERVRNELKADRNFVVVHVGAFLYAKNHKFIIKIFNELLKIKSNSILWLIGTGGNQNEIQQLVREMELNEKVIFLGKRTDVSDVLSAADCFLFPSFYEGFPNAVLEAQTSGLPCMISDKITSEVVIREECAQLSLDLPAIEWAKKIADINENFNREISYELIKKHGFSVKDEILKIENIYRGVVSNNKN